MDADDLNPGTPIQVEVRRAAGGPDLEERLPAPLAEPVLDLRVDAGETVVVVEHDLSVIAAADRVLEMGPGAAAAGGRIIADVTPAGLGAADTATGRALRARSS